MKKKRMKQDQSNYRNHFILFMLTLLMKTSADILTGYLICPFKILALLSKSCKQPSHPPFSSAIQYIFQSNLVDISAIITWSL